jgi:hypothetical protein
MSFCESFKGGRIIGQVGSPGNPQTSREGVKRAAASAAFPRSLALTSSILAGLEIVLSRFVWWLGNCTNGHWWLGRQFRRRPPFDTGRDILFVAYYASAEVGCFLALGWLVPVRFSTSSRSLCGHQRGKSCGQQRTTIRIDLLRAGRNRCGEKEGNARSRITGGPWSREEIHAIRVLPK